MSLLPQEQHEIRVRVNEIMHQGFEIPMEKLTPNATLAGDLELDSLDAIDMLVQLEEKMNVKVSGERLMSVKTLQDIYILIEELSQPSKTQALNSLS